MQATRHPEARWLGKQNTFLVEDAHAFVLGPCDTQVGIKKKSPDSLLMSQVQGGASLTNFSSRHPREKLS